MAGDDEEILALFQELPGLLGMRFGQVRIAPRYNEGSLLRLSLQVREFRIPANRLSRSPPRERFVSADAQAVLEKIAARLHATSGEAEIVAEYKDRRLRWIDLVYAIEIA